MVYNGILMETIGNYVMVSIGLLLFFLAGLYEICWRAYDTHLPHNLNPTHRVAYTTKVNFFRINSTSFHLAHYLYAPS